MKNSSVLVAALIGTSIVIASFVLTFSRGDKAYDLSASAKGVYVVDKLSGRVLYCVSAAEVVGLIFTKYTYRQDDVVPLQVSVIKTFGTHAPAS